MIGRHAPAELPAGDPVGPGTGREEGRPTWATASLGGHDEQPERAARVSAARHGMAVLYLVDGQPVRVRGAYLLGGESAGAGIEARRIDLGEPFCGVPPRPWSRQVWARPLGGGMWGRGRLRIDEDRVVFLDEPGAVGPERGKGRERGPMRRSFGADLLGCQAVRCKAARSEIYAQLLYVCLADSRWQHGREAPIHELDRRDAAGLVAQAVGAGDYRDWIGRGPDGVLDEEVLTDLGALGWRRVGVCERGEGRRGG